MLCKHPGTPGLKENKVFPNPQVLIAIILLFPIPMGPEHPTYFQFSQQMVVQGEQAGISQLRKAEQQAGRSFLWFLTAPETKSLPNMAPGLCVLFICSSPWEPLQLPTHFWAVQEDILARNYNHDDHQVFLSHLLHNPSLPIPQPRINRDRGNF